jgi:hypothetical protein
MPITRSASRRMLLSGISETNYHPYQPHPTPPMPMVSSPMPMIPSFQYMVPSFQQKHMVSSQNIPMAAIMEQPPPPPIQEAPSPPPDPNPIVPEIPPEIAEIPQVLDLPDLPIPRLINPAVHNGNNPFTITMHALQTHVLVGYMRKDRIIIEKVGMNVATLLKKLDDQTLDHIHHRSLRRYLIDWKNDMDKQAEERENRRRVQQQMAPMPTSNTEQVVQPVSSTTGMVSCPCLKMGYAGVECTEKMHKNKVLDHVAGHVATLIKRVNELEKEVDELRNHGKAVVLDV